MLWAITSYFNPMGYKSRPANYRTFRKYLTAPLLAVELSFTGTFELQPGDLIYTGTPEGVAGVTRGQTMVGGIDGLGELKVRVA